MNDRQYLEALKAAHDAGKKEEFTTLFKLAGGWAWFLPLAIKGCGPKSKQPRAASKPKVDEPEGFPAWYAEYPRHEARGAAARAFRTALTRTSIESLTSAMRRYKAACVGKEPEYIKHPATWLNGRCWEDEALPTSTSSAHVIPFASPDAWLTRLELFYGLKDQPRGTWGTPETWGPPPDSPGCRAPAEVLARFATLHPGHCQQTKFG